MSQTPLCQEDWAAEPNEPCRFSTQFRHAVECRLRSFNRRYTSFKEALSGFRKSQSPSGALQQTYTKPFFQCRNTSAKARFLNANYACGRGKSAILDDRSKEVDIV